MSSDKEHLFYKKMQLLKKISLEEVNNEKQKRLAEEQKIITRETEEKQKAYTFFIKIMTHKNSK